MEEEWLNCTSKTQINKVPWPAQKGLTADHFHTAGKQHLPFARLGQFHKPWCGHCMLCSLRHWPLSIPCRHIVRMQSFCPSQLQSPRPRNCLLSQLGNLWKNGEEGPYRCSWYSRVTSTSVYPCSQPLTMHRWDVILSTNVPSTRQAVEGEITMWPVPQPALQPPLNS